MLGLFEKPKDPTLAVTSLDPKDWREDAKESAERNGLRHRLKSDDAVGNTVILRKYYPLRARLRKLDGVLGFQAGTILKFARVKRTPERFPIEVFFSGKTPAGQTKTVTVNYDSADVELLGIV